jgi:endonuclease YncB( thermonuclease family)
MGLLRVAEFTTSAIAALPLQMVGVGLDTVSDVLLNKVVREAGQTRRVPYSWMESSLNPGRRLEGVFRQMKIKKHHLPYLLAYMLASSALDADSGAINTEPDLQSRFFDPGQQLGAFTLTAAASAILYRTGAARHPTAIMSSYFHRIGESDEAVEKAARSMYKLVGAESKGFSFDQFLERFQQVRGRVVNAHPDAKIITTPGLLEQMAADNILDEMNLTRNLGESKGTVSLRKTGISMRGRVKAAAIGFVAVHVGLNVLSQILPAETLYYIHRLPLVGSALEFITGVKPKKAPNNEYFYKTGFKGSEEQAGLFGTIRSFLRMATLGAWLPKDALYSDKPDPFLSIGGRIGQSYKADRAVTFLQTAGAAMDISMSQYVGGGKVGNKAALLAYYRGLKSIYDARGGPPRQDRATIHNQLGDYDFEYLGSSKGLMLALQSRQYRLEHLRSQRPIEIRMAVTRDLILSSPELRGLHPATLHLGKGQTLFNPYWSGLMGSMTWRAWERDPNSYSKYRYALSMRGDDLLKSVGLSDDVQTGSRQSREGGLEVFGIEASRLITPLGFVALGLLPGAAVGIMSTAAGVANYVRQRQKASVGGFVEQVLDLSSFARGENFLDDDLDNWNLTKVNGYDVITKTESGRVLTIGSAVGIDFGKLDEGKAPHEVIQDVRRRYQAKINALFNIQTQTLVSGVSDLDTFFSEVAEGKVSDVGAKIRQTADQLSEKFIKTLNEGVGSGRTTYGAVFFQEPNVVVGQGNINELSRQAKAQLRAELIQDLVEALDEISKVLDLDEYKQANAAGKKVILAAMVGEKLNKVRQLVSHRGVAPTPDVVSVQEKNLYRTAKSLQSETESFLKSVYKGMVPTAGLVYGYVVYGKDAYTLLEGTGALLSAGKLGNYYAAKSVAQTTVNLVATEATQQILRRVIPGQSTFLGSIATMGAFFGSMYALDKFSRSSYGRWTRDLNDMILNQSTNLIYSGGKLITGSLVGKSAFVGLSALAGYAVAGKKGAAVASALGVLAVEGSTFRTFDKYIAQPLFDWSLQYRYSTNPMHQMLAEFFIPKDSRWVEMAASERTGPRSPFYGNRYWFRAYQENKALQRAERALQGDQLDDEFLSPELLGQPIGFWHKMRWEALTKGGGRVASSFNPYLGYISRSMMLQLKQRQDRINRIYLQVLEPKILPNQAFAKTGATALSGGLMLGVNLGLSTRLAPGLAVAINENQLVTDLNRQSTQDRYAPTDYLYRYRELQSYRWGARIGGMLGFILPRGVSELAGTWVAEQFANWGWYDKDAQDAYDAAPLQMVGRTSPGASFYRMNATSPLMNWLSPILKTKWQNWFSGDKGKFHFNQWLRPWAQNALKNADEFLNGEIVPWTTNWANIPLEGKGFWPGAKRVVYGIASGIGAGASWVGNVVGGLGNTIGRWGSSRWMAPVLLGAGVAMLAMGGLQKDNQNAFFRAVATITAAAGMLKGHAMLITRFQAYRNFFQARPMMRLGLYGAIFAATLIGTGSLSWAGITPGEGLTKTLLWAGVGAVGVGAVARHAGASRWLSAGLLAGAVAGTLAHEQGRSFVASSLASFVTLGAVAASPLIWRSTKQFVVRQAQRQSVQRAWTRAGDAVNVVIPQQMRAEAARRISENLQVAGEVIPRSVHRLYRGVSRHFWSLLGYGMDLFGIASGASHLFTQNKAGGFNDALAYDALLQMRASTRSLSGTIIGGAILGGWGETIGSLGSGMFAEEDARYIGAVIHDAKQANVSATTLGLRQLKDSSRSITFSAATAGLILTKLNPPKDVLRVPWHKVMPRLLGYKPPTPPPALSPNVAFDLAKRGLAVPTVSAYKISPSVARELAARGYAPQGFVPPAGAAGPRPGFKTTVIIDSIIGAGIAASGIHKWATAKNKYERASGIRRTFGGLAQIGGAVLGATLATAVVGLLALTGPLAFLAGWAVYSATQMLTEHIVNVSVDHVLENWVPSDQKVTSRYNKKAWKETTKAVSSSTRRVYEFKQNMVVSGKEREIPIPGDTPGVGKGRGTVNIAYKGKVEKVRDADTLELGPGIVLRLRGTDALELDQDKKSSLKLAKKAKERLAELTSGTIRYGTTHKDLYGRFIASVYNEQGKDVESVLVEEGLTFVRPQLQQLDPDTYYRYKRLEDKARAEKKGVWSDKARKEYQYPWDFRDGKKDEEEEEKKGNWFTNIFKGIANIFTGIGEWLFGGKAEAAVPPSAIEKPKSKYVDTRLYSKDTGKAETREGSRENALQRFWNWAKKQAKRAWQWVQNLRRREYQRRASQAQITDIPQEGQEVSVHALVQQQMAGMLGLGSDGAIPGLPKKWSDLSKDLTKDPHYNPNTWRGRTAQAVAISIGLVELTDMRPGEEYSQKGGYGKKPGDMSGFAQIYRDLHPGEWETPERYRRTTGIWFSGSGPTPSGKKNSRFNVEGFYADVRSGKIYDRDTWYSGLVRHGFTKDDFDPLDNTRGEEWPRATQEQIQALIRYIRTDPQPSQQKPGKLKSPDISRLMAVANMAGRTTGNETLGETDLGQRLAAAGKKWAEFDRSKGLCYTYAANAIEEAVTGRIRSGYLQGESAWMAADQLAQKKEFRELQGFTLEQMHNLPLGSVLVWGSGMSNSGSPHGHIAVVTGKGKISSDFTEDISRYTSTKGVRVFLPAGTPTEKKEPQAPKFQGIQQGQYFGIGAQRYLEEQAFAVGGEDAKLMVRKQIEAYNASLPENVRQAALGAQAKGIDVNNFVRPSGTVRVGGSTPTSTSSGMSDQMFSPIKGVSLERVISYKPSQGQGFDAMRAGGRIHSKVDFDGSVGAGQGAVIQAIQGGVATYRPWTSDSGVVIVTTQDAKGRKVEYEYGHLSLAGIRKLFGDKTSINVTGGQALSTVTTDSLSSGPHLDLGIKVDGKYVHPQQFLRNPSQFVTLPAPITTVSGSSSSDSTRQNPALPPAPNPKPTQAPATGRTYWRMTPTGSLDSMGNIIMRVDVINAKGEVVDGFNAISGRAGAQNLRTATDQLAVPRSSDKSEPIPEGVYRVGGMINNLTRLDPKNKQYQLIGDFWIGLDNTVPGQARSGFGIHQDLQYGKPGGHGSEGCVVVGSKEEVRRVQELYQRFRPSHFVVDYGKGSLPSEYKKPEPPGTRNRAQEKVSSRLDERPSPAVSLALNVRDQKRQQIAVEQIQPPRRFLTPTTARSPSFTPDKVFDPATASPSLDLVASIGSDAGIPAGVKPKTIVEPKDQPHPTGRGRRNLNAEFRALIMNKEAVQLFDAVGNYSRSMYDKVYVVESGSDVQKALLDIGKRAQNRPAFVSMNTHGGAEGVLAITPNIGGGSISKYSNTFL